LREVGDRVGHYHFASPSGLISAQRRLFAAQEGETVRAAERLFSFSNQGTSERKAKFRRPAWLRNRGSAWDRVDCLPKHPGGNRNGEANRTGCGWATTMIPQVPEARSPSEKLNEAESLNQ
jgi:hypothetical protein